MFDIDLTDACFWVTFHMRHEKAAPFFHQHIRDPFALRIALAFAHSRFPGGV
jgi:hypothetical protein